MDIRALIGSNVQRLRQKRGWSQEDLDFESGLHRTYVSGIERGVRNPTVIIIERLALTFEVKPAALFANWAKPE